MIELATLPRIRRTLEMTGAQASALVALEKWMKVLQIRPACPRCLQAQEPEPWVWGSNAVGDLAWSAECACTKRAILPSTCVPIPITPELLMAADRLWKDIDLTLRCQTSVRCRLTPLTHRWRGDYFETRCPCRVRRGSGSVRAVRGVH